MTHVIPLPTLDVVPWKLHPMNVAFLFTEKKTDLSRAEIQQRFAAVKDEHLDYQFTYTDGSKDGMRAGNGIVSDGLANLEGRLPHNTSVFVAELHALFVALRLIEHFNIRQACICSDSR